MPCRGFTGREFKATRHLLPKEPSGRDRAEGGATIVW